MSKPDLYYKGNPVQTDVYWRPINTFDHRMFSLMSNGTPDTCEVVKYKGYLPEWATQWCPLPYIVCPEAE